MPKNMTWWDRIIRAIIGVVFIYLVISKNFSGTVYDILGIIGLVFLITAAIGFCPLYTLFGRKAKRK